MVRFGFTAGCVIFIATALPLRSGAWEPTRGPSAVSRAYASIAPQRGSGVFVCDTAWIGHVASPTSFPGVPGGHGPFHVGRGVGAGSTSGIWNFSSLQPSESDSLLGWLPFRRAYSIVGGEGRPDWRRPWWAIDIGNQANAGSHGSASRPSGVVGVWHRDDSGPPVAIPGTNPPPPAWTVIAGAYSAWMGLRAHGDVRFVDPLTGNPLNETVLAFNGERATSPSGNDKSFPGYGSQMDQLMYRDIDLTGGGAANLQISFSYSTNMSTGFESSAETRTGWFHHDPLSMTFDGSPGSPNFAPGNFISSSDAGAAASVDSFMVYVGAPVGATFVGSDGFVHPVYDPTRRWFSETVRSVEGLYREVFATAGIHAPTSVIVTIPNSVLAPILAASGERVRLVFRVKTNRGWDDEGTAYSSGGAGAAVVDQVAYSYGATSSPLGWGEFESEGAIDNRVSVDPLNAWKTTGKAPLAIAHPHALADLPLDPRSGVENCDLQGTVVSFGDHDNFETSGGQVAGTADFEQTQGLVSPTILLSSAGPGVYNAMGIDAEIASRDIHLRYDVYTGNLQDAFNNYWTIGVQSFPAAGPSGYPAWGEVRYLPYLLFNPAADCMTDIESLSSQGLIRTSNASGVPDSIRVIISTTTRSFNSPYATWPASNGAYFDNVAIAFADEHECPPTVCACPLATTLDANPSVIGAEGYVAITTCVLRMLHALDWATLDTEDAEALTEYSQVLTTARNTLRSVVVDEVVPAVSAEDRDTFGRIVRRSQILDELDQLQLLMLQDTTGSPEAKRTARQEAENSVKKLLQALADKAPWGLGELVKGLLDVINEILATIRGSDPESTSLGVDLGHDVLERAIQLGQNTPNPFRIETTIHYVLAREEPVQVVIFDLMGRKVMTLFDGTQEAGTHSLKWNGTDGAGRPVESGVYFYEVRAHGVAAVRRAILVK